jgi:hypothetical protein
MAVLVSFRKYREDAGSVEYLFGFDQPVRRLRFDKASPTTEGPRRVRTLRSPR